MELRRKAALAAAAVTAIPALAVILPAGQASAHGTLSDPASRVYVCKQEDPENPKSAACKAAVAAAGTQAFYDWNEVSLLDRGRPAPPDHPRRQAVQRRSREVPRPRPRRGRLAREADLPGP